MKPAAPEMMNAKGMAVEMVPAVAMIVMLSAEDEVTATVRPPTAVIGADVGTTHITTRKISTFASGT
jgi:hypothetical protein